MKSVWPAAGLILVAFVFTAGISSASENTRLFLDGITDYHNGDFSGAAEKFHKIAQKDVKNGRLYYNLGNAYLKNGDLGRAMLWYNRAERLIPNDPDLEFNLAYARSQLKDLGENDGNPVFHILFFWKYLLSDQAVKWTAVVLNLIFWSGLLVVLYAGRRPSKLFFILIGLGAAVFILTAGVNLVEKRTHHTAVIVADEASIMSAPGQNATELFILHSGTCVSVEQTRKGYIKIRFSNDKIGWIKNDLLEMV